MTICFDSDRCRDMVQTTIEHIDSAQRSLQRVLTWTADMNPTQRGDYTRALNALELASCRMRGVFRDIKAIPELL